MAVRWISSMLVLALFAAVGVSTQAQDLNDLDSRLNAARQRLAEIRARQGGAAAPAAGYQPAAAAYGRPAPLPPRGVMHPGRLRVGVLPFDNNVPQIPGNYVTGLEAMVISEGLNRTEWSMLDRVVTSNILTEQKFARSGLVRRGTGPAANQNLGAQVLIKGVVTGLTQNSSGGGFGIGFGGFSVGHGGSKSTLSMDIRIIDAATGEVLAAGSRSAKIKSSDLAVGINFRNAPPMQFNNFKNSPAGEAARGLVGQILELLAEGVRKVVIATPHQTAWSGRVAKVEGSMVYINGGQDQDLGPGMVLRVFRQRDAIVDPQTGENLGAAKSPAGALRIVDVQPRFATCEVIEGGPMSVNDIVEQQ